MNNPLNPQEKESRAKDLEAIIRRDSKITIKDRLWNAWQNVKENRMPLFGTALALTLGGIAAYSWVEYAYLESVTKPFMQAESYLKGLKEIFFTLHPKDIPLSLDNALQPALAAINEGAKHYDSAAVRELTEIVNANSEAYKNLNHFNFLAETQPVLDALHKIAHGTTKMAYFTAGVATTLGSLLSLLCSLPSLMASKWCGHLHEKRASQRIFNDNLPRLIEDINAHPFADEIYSFAGWASRDASGITLYHTLSDLVLFREERYAPVFKKLATPSGIQYTAPNAIANAFAEFLVAENNLNEQKEKAAAAEKEQLAEDERLRNFEAVYSILIDRKWTHDISNKMAIKIAEEDNKGRMFWIELLKKAEYGFPMSETSVYLDLFKFYKDCELERNKKKRIIERIIKNEDSNLAHELANLPFHINSNIMNYISGLDEVPALGIKGQIDALLKIKTFYTFLIDCGNAEKGAAELEELLTFKAPKIDEGIVEITRFMDEHSEIPVNQVIPLLLEYYHFSNGLPYQSNRVKKDNKEESAKFNNSDLKNAKKFLEELKAKLGLAKYAAFNRFIDNSVIIPLRAITGESLEDIAIKNPEELTHIVYSLNHIGYTYPNIAGECKRLLKAYLPAPDKIQSYLDSLEGNKSLEIRLARIGAWKKGLEKSYTLQKEGNNEKICRQLEHEYRQFRKNVSALGIDLPAAPDYSNLEQKADEAINRVGTIISSREDHHFRRALKHLEKIKEKQRAIQNKGNITFYDAKDPVEAMQMGIVTGSCTNLRTGAFAFSSFVNAIDANKKVVYMANEAGKKVGRTLAVLTDSGIVTFRKYDSSSLDTDNSWLDYFLSYAKQVGTPLILPDKFLSRHLHKQLASRGFRPRPVNVLMHKAVCSEWFDDINSKTVPIEAAGYRMDLYAFVVPPQ